MKFFWVFNRQRGRANTSSLYPVWYWQALTICLGAWWSPWVRKGINSFTLFHLSFLREGFKVSRCKQFRQELDLIRHSSVHTEVISGPAHSHTRCELFPLGKGQSNSLPSRWRWLVGIMFCAYVQNLASALWVCLLFLISQDQITHWKRNYHGRCWGIFMVPLKAN